MSISNYIHCRARCRIELYARYRNHRSGDPLVRIGESEAWAELERQWITLTPSERAHITDIALITPWSIHTLPEIECHPPLTLAYRQKVQRIIESLDQATD